MIDDEIIFCKLNDSAIIPNKLDENAGYDIYANFDEDFLAILPFQTRLISTGICGALPTKYYFQVEERSSTGSKGIKKSAGVIDSGYRGEYKIAITNITGKLLLISKISENELPDIIYIAGENFKKQDCLIYPYSKAIAQLILHEVPKVKVREVGKEEFEKLSSIRGKGGFGSTNK